MDDYAQPTFYRFNQDSLLLVEFVCALATSSDRILDLGAGCGILGIELARALRPTQLVLLEVQEDYRPFLEKNLQEFLPSKIKSEININPFSQFYPNLLFDLIVCNPPYYLPGHGQASSDHRRGIARSFLKDDWKILLDLIRRCLSQTGRAFIVIKNDSRIIEEVEKNSQGLTVLSKSVEDLILMHIIHSG